MNINWKVAAATLILLVAGLAGHLYSQGTRTAQTLNQFGPYVLNNTDFGTLLLDSQSGTTWMLVIQQATDGTKRYVFSQVLKSQGTAAPSQ